VKQRFAGLIEELKIELIEAKVTYPNLEASVPRAHAASGKRRDRPPR
jgi:hypothetical protein